MSPTVNLQRGSHNETEGVGRKRVYPPHSCRRQLTWFLANEAIRCEPSEEGNIGGLFDPESSVSDRKKLCVRPLLNVAVSMKTRPLEGAMASLSRGELTFPRFCGNLVDRGIKESDP